MIKHLISLTLFKVQQGEELAHIEHFLIIQRLPSYLRSNFATFMFLFFFCKFWQLHPTYPAKPHLPKACTKWEASFKPDVYLLSITDDA